MSPSRHRLYLSIIAALIVVIGVMSYKFIVAGSTEPGKDGRVVIVLEPGERALMLSEMRGFVGGLRTISEALSREDMASVAKAAREMGTAKSHDVPPALIGKLPLEFKTLAFGVHHGFDTVAEEAEASPNPRQSLRRLSEVLQKCTACHDSYSINSEAPVQ